MSYSSPGRLDLNIRT